MSAFAYNETAHSGPRLSDGRAGAARPSFAMNASSAEAGALRLIGIKAPAYR
jgi:hypothetical protein